MFYYCLVMYTTDATVHDEPNLVTQSKF